MEAASMAQLGTIVVADDEALARQSVAEVLEEEGYRVYQAADGTAALKLLEDHEVDLILSDLRMPRADGLAVLKTVRDLYP
jgi:CheY-like chemotaxis protein